MPTLAVWVLHRLNLAKVTFGLIAFNLALILVLGLATLGIAVMSSDTSEENQINCSGVSWDTPYQLKGVDYMERFGTFFHKMADGKDSAEDAVYLVRAVKDTISLWINAFKAPALDDLEAAKAVTGYREADRRAREKALRFCCVQLRKSQGNQGGSEQPKVEAKPGIPDDPQPWDPKSAAFQNQRSRFNDEQMDIARITRRVAQQHRIGERGVLIALEAGFVESGVVNLNWGDRDSLGWLQQRPSTGWGTRAEIRNPQLAVQAFFGVATHTRNRGLTDIDGWQHMPMGRAAQAVQVSAFPGRYAAREQDARALLAAIGGMKAASPQASIPKAKASKPAPKFDPTQPFAAYCASLDVEDEKAGVRPGSGKPRDEQGGGPVPAEFNQQGNPRTVEQAIAALTAAAPRGFPGERVSGRCERHMNLAYGLGGGYPTAIAHWYAPGPRSTSADPPRGALVFFRTNNPAGHVALSLGNGIVASTDYDPTTGRFKSGVIGIGPLTDVAKWGPYLGWRAPNFKPGTEGVNI